MTAYAGLMLVTGIGVTLNRFATQVHAGELLQAQRMNLAPAVDMVIFPLVFLAAVAFRNRPEVHKRLMVIATTGLLFAAVARMNLFGGYPVFVGLWLSPIFVGMAHDVWRYRMVHPAYVFGLMILSVSALRYRAVDSSWWHSATTYLATLF